MFLPAIQLSFIGDRFSGTILDRKVKLQDGTKILIMDLHLDEPRTQAERIEDDWAWWLHPGQAMAELYRIIKTNNGPFGSPFPGDWVSCELVGYKLTDKSPKKLHTVEWKQGNMPKSLVEDELW